MGTLEVNKVCAAVLVAGIAYMLSSVVGGALVHAPRLEKPAIAIAAPAGGTATAEAQPDPPVETLLAAADPARGKTDTTRAGCVACHTFDEGGKAGIGPNLYGVVAPRMAICRASIIRAALKAKQGPWTYDELYEWLKKPSGYAPGTKMTFAGIAEPQGARRHHRLPAHSGGQPRAAAGGAGAGARGAGPADDAAFGQPEPAADPAEPVPAATAGQALGTGRRARPGARPAEVSRTAAGGAPRSRGPLATSSGALSGQGQGRALVFRRPGGRLRSDQIADSDATRWSISASLCSGEGVMRSRSVPRGTVG